VSIGPVDVDDVVQKLAGEGFDASTDTDEAHISIKSSRLGLVEDADRVHAFLKLNALHDGAQVDATYDPGDGTATLLVTWRF
jgi:hypothetical protein